MKKVLVLEDEASIRGFIVINLRRAGYDVIEAESGEEALERLRENPDARVALLGIMFPCSWLLFQYGYKAGTNAAHHILAGGLKDRITQAAGVVGLVVVGAITASYTSVNLGLVYQQGEMQLSLADSISSMMMPKLPVLLMAFLSYYLMVIRKWSVQKMMILLLAVSVLGYFTTVLAV